MTPAVMMVGCSDYEDTEVASPEANADAIGAYFEKNSNPVKLLPGKTSFNITLKRASAGDAVNVPFKVVENKNDFFELPVNQFAFEAGKQSSTPIAVSFNIGNAVFQKNDTLYLQVLDGVKDHLYAAGYTDTMYPFVIDYTWKSDSLASTMVKDEYANTFTGEGTLATVEIAKDFEVVKTNPSKAAGKDHIQFVVDKDHQNPQFLSTGYLAGKEISLTVNESELETGMTQKFAEKKEYPICMDLVDIDVIAATAEAKTDNVTYLVKYNLYAFDKETEKKYQLSEADDATPVVGTTPYQAKFEVKFVKASAE